MVKMEKSKEKKKKTKSTPGKKITAKVKPEAKKTAPPKPRAKKPLLKKPVPKAKIEKKAKEAEKAKKVPIRKAKERKVAVKKPVKRVSGKDVRAVVEKRKSHEAPAKEKTSIVVVKDVPAKKKSGLSKEDIDYFRRVLNEKRSRIIEKMRDTINEGMKLDESDLPDEYDMASSEYLQYFKLRLRGRERYFLEKIDAALQRIEEGTFGLCEVCGEEIGMARLMARPETTLCIRCKETQERQERQFTE
jgi:DnaK suppressor protein